MTEEMMLTSCPHCHWKFKVNALSAGKPGRCQKCGNTFTLEEFVEQPIIYKPSRHEPRAETDETNDILSAPVQTPSYPSLKAIAAGPRSQARANGGSYARTPIGEGRTAPSYWALRVLAVGHAVIGAIAILSGLVLLIGRADTQAVAAIGLVASGIFSLAVGQALAALRDIAINSFLAIDR